MEDGASEGEPLTSPSALGERRHRSLARRLIAVRRTFDVPAVPARPHPRAALRRSRKDEADDLAVLQHVVVLLIIADGRTLEDQRGHHGGGGGGGGLGGLGGGGFGLVDNMLLVRLTWHDEVAMAMAGLHLRLASLAFSLV